MSAQEPSFSTTSGPLADVPPICAALHAAKAAKGLSFADLAAATKRNEVYVASIFFGQAKPTPEDLAALCGALGMDAHAASAALGAHFWPNRGLGPMPPTDPLLYRLYEGVLVFGHPIKAVIHEKFGDGIMSMIDVKVDVARKEDPKGARVVLTFECVPSPRWLRWLIHRSGKFLPYNPW